MLQIRLLGQFDVRTEGKRVTIPSRAGQSLLAYLALTAGTPHRREKLAGTFWPDTTDENARKNLRQELWRIRKAISTQGPTESDYLIADEFTLKFNREAKYWLDVVQMERPDHDLQSLIANLSLYQGELLPGFYDEWIPLERERVQAAFDARMEQLLEQLTTAERWVAVQEWGERWLTLSGACEPAYRALMLASGARGDMTRVAALYQRCMNELMEHLGIEPSAETRALYDGLLKGTQARRVSAQPSGTITFLFTDIEGSTRLLEKLGDQYAVALSEHHEILRAAIQKWDGREMDTLGDSFFVTFTRALDAVQCAAEAQRALASHAWHQGEALRVRMGLHTGEPLIASTGYVGMDVHRAARIGDAGHGGQILLSQTTRELVAQDLPEGLTIRNLGEFRLKDMKFPTPIYQLVVDGLPADFAPIRTRFTGTEAPTPGEAPFKGLQFFDVEDSELFFGREALTTKLVQRLRSANFLSVIIGASGSGKSSLVRAGVVPSIRKGNVNWHIHILTPTAHPLEALAIELTGESESVTAAATLLDDLSKDPRSLHFFLSRQTQTRNKAHTLLVIDQFEELFTLCRDNFEREAFIDNLLFALTPTLSPLGEGRTGEGHITLLITLRADFYAHLAQYPELRDAVAQQQEYIGPMTSEELRRAIEEPARRGRWEFEPGLVDLILRDVGDEPGALPLLSHALLETWKRRAGHVLTLKGYADAGGVRGAIAHTAESVFQSLSLDEQTIMRNILLRLTEFGEGTEDTRRRASFDELMSSGEAADDARAVLNRLAEARLVTLSEDTAEVAHEALIREWPRLREWLSQDREGILLHRHLTEAAQEWELLERDAGSLYRGARLAQANEWSALNPNTLNAQERLFLEASNNQMRHEEKEREDQLQRERDAAVELAETQRQSALRLRTRNRVITTIASLAVILAMLAGMLGLQSNRNATTAQNNAATAQVARDDALNAQATAEAERLRAESEKQLAVSRELAIAAVNNLDIDPERSILLALRAFSSADTREAREALHQTIQSLRVEFTLPGSAQSIAYSPDGTRLAVGGEGYVQVLDANTGKEMLRFAGNADQTNWGIVFSPDGTRLAIANDHNQATVWNAISGKESLTLSGHTNYINHITFSPDGTRIATGSDDNTARVWDAVTGQELLVISHHADIVSGVAFSPDGKRLITGSRDNTVKIWNIETGTEALTLQGDAAIAGLYSPDGMHILTRSTDGITVTLWDAATGKELFTIVPGFIAYYAFSADGKRLVAGGQTGTIAVWDAATGDELLTIPSPYFINGWGKFALHPNGNHAAAASPDGTVRVWDISTGGSRELFTLVPHDGYWVRRILYSPDGTRFATAGMDGTAKVFDAKTGNELLTLSGHSNSIFGLACSPDGTRLATASHDKTVKVWDMTSGKLLMTLSKEGHGEGIYGGLFPGILDIAFSADGARLASAGADGTVIVWDVATGKELLMLPGNGNGIIALAFSPDGIHLATSSDGGFGFDPMVTMWDLTTRQVVFATPKQSSFIFGLAFDKDGTRFATGAVDGVLRLWDSKTGNQLLSSPGHTYTISDIRFSADGQYIATAGFDGIAKIWDAKTGKELLTLTGHTGGISGVSFSPDGTRIATSSADGTARVYLLNIEELIALAKSRVTRSLTMEECQKYLHVDECPAEP